MRKMNDFFFFRRTAEQKTNANNTKLVGIGHPLVASSTRHSCVSAQARPFHYSAESIAKMSFPTFKDLDKEASGKDQNRCVAQEILWAKILSAAANILFGPVEYVLYCAIHIHALR